MLSPNISMNSIITLLHIMLLREAPQQLPDNKELLISLCAFDVFISIIMAIVGGSELAASIFWACIAKFLFVIIFLKYLLNFFNLSMRFRQTVIAIMGISNLMLVTYLAFSILLIVIYPYFIVIIALAGASLLIWYQRVLAHIFFYVMQVDLSYAIGIAMFYMTIGFFVWIIVFGLIIGDEIAEIINMSIVRSLF